MKDIKFIFFGSLILFSLFFYSTFLSSSQEEKFEGILTDFHFNYRTKANHEYYLIVNEKKYYIDKRILGAFKKDLFEKEVKIGTLVLITIKDSSIYQIEYNNKSFINENSREKLLDNNNLSGSILVIIMGLISLVSFYHLIKKK